MCTSKVMLVVCVGALSGCGSFIEAKPRTEYYYPAVRQLPMEQVYSRLTWSQLPKAIGPSNRENGPYIQPVIDVDLRNSTLEEAIEALGQTMGYERQYPASVASRRVSITKVGTVDEILSEIGAQAGVVAELDREKRILRVLDRSTQPRL